MNTICLLRVKASYDVCLLSAIHLHQCKQDPSHFNSQWFGFKWFAFVKIKLFLSLKMKSYHVWLTPISIIKILRHRIIHIVQIVPGKQLHYCKLLLMELLQHRTKPVSIAIVVPLFKIVYFYIPYKPWFKISQTFF